MADDEGPAREDEAPALPDDLSATETHARVETILAAFHGRQTSITDAGRENMRTMNRLTRIIPLRMIRAEKSFRQNISRYHTDSLDQDVLIGARREGNGVWSLVAELAPRER